MSVFSMSAQELEFGLGAVPKEQLNEVVDAIKHALSEPSMRALSQRAVQAKIWHECPVVASTLQTLRESEEAIRGEILALTSKLVYQLHEHALDATLNRAGILNGATLSEFGSVCLDAKERLYIILKEYDWLQDFFRRYPIHFYENSFQFVNNIPDKPLRVKVKVVGLGIGGSMAVSGLAKRGIAVHGYEKRPEHGPRSVTSRYQNASWRAYDTAKRMVNDTAYQLLAEHRQRIHVPQDDGSTHVVETDRVQIILGSAVQAALDSARSYGAQLHFECSSDDIYPDSNVDDDDCDIVALFCGAHTVSAFPEAFRDIWTWPELDSSCLMWLRVQLSDKTAPYCTRGGEIGAEHWHYTIESARRDIRDMERVGWNQISNYEYKLTKFKATGGTAAPEQTEESLAQEHDARRSKLAAVLHSVREQQMLSGDKECTGCRFDYIFTNAPCNEHNMSKKEQVADSIVIDGTYTVQVQMAANSTATSGELLKRLGTKLVILGGDATVPPNPMAAYGATLACEAAASVVLLATAVGHLNAIIHQLELVPDCQHVWVEQLHSLESLLHCHYEARSRSETYFQFVQTLICNAYSLPPFY